MTRTLTLFVAGSVAGVAALSGLGFARDGVVGLLSTLVAGLICIVPTTLSLMLALWSRGRSGSDQLMAVMGGMAFRMVSVLAVGMVVFLNVPQLRETRERELAFWSAVLICYLGTLAWETILSARARRAALATGAGSAALKVGE